MTDDAQSLAERRGTSVHATESLLCNLREQKIKQSRPSAPSDAGTDVLSAASHDRPGPPRAVTNTRLPTPLRMPSSTRPNSSALGPWFRPNSMVRPDQQQRITTRPVPPHPLYVLAYPAARCTLRHRVPGGQNPAGFHLCAIQKPMLLSSSSVYNTKHRFLKVHRPSALVPAQRDSARPINLAPSPCRGHQTTDAQLGTPSFCAASISDPLPFSIRSYILSVCMLTICFSDTISMLILLSRGIRTRTAHCVPVALRRQGTGAKQRRQAIKHGLAPSQPSHLFPTIVVLALKINRNDQRG
jgi:hypothetical protein